jgi:hypothetical protein
MLKDLGGHTRRNPRSSGRSIRAAKTMFVSIVCSHQTCTHSDDFLEWMAIVFLQTLMFTYSAGTFLRT